MRGAVPLLMICLRGVVFTSAQGRLYLYRTCYGPEDFVPAACLSKESTFDPVRNHEYLM